MISAMQWDKIHNFIFENVCALECFLQSTISQKHLFIVTYRILPEWY